MVPIAYVVVALAVPDRLRASYATGGANASERERKQ